MWNKKGSKEKDIKIILVWSYTFFKMRLKNQR